MIVSFNFIESNQNLKYFLIRNTSHLSSTVPLLRTYIYIKYKTVYDMHIYFLFDISNENLFLK